MNKRNNPTVVAVLAIVVLAVFTSPATACNDLHGWIQKYQSPDASDESRQTALRKMAGRCRGYIAVTSDELLLDVLQDALKRPYDKEVIQSIFSRYRCIPGVIGQEDYDVLLNGLDTASCPTGVDRQNWFVVSVSGALLRSRPAKSSRRVGWVKRGIVVEKLAKHGDWLKVKTWSNKTGFIRQDLLAIY